MLFLFCCALTTPFYQYTKQAISVRQFAFYAILLLSSYLINCYIQKNLFLFLFPHLVLIVLLFYLPIPIMDKCFCMILWAFLIGFDIMFWCNKTQAKALVMPLPFAFTYPILYWYLGRSTIDTDPIYQSLSYYFGILYLILALLSSYLMNTKYIEPMEENTGYTPTKEILKSNNRMVFSIGGVLLFATFFLRYPPVEAFLTSAFTLMKQGILSLLSFVLRLLRSTPAIPEVENIEISDIPQEPLPIATTNPFFDLLQEILIFVVYFAFITGLILTISLAIYRFIKKYLYYHPTTPIMEEDEFSVIVTKERLTKTKHKKEEIDTCRNNNQKIRYYYKKKIKRTLEKTKFLDQSLTPNERANITDSNSDKDLKDLTSLYNRARYSNETMTKEEAKEAKTYL